MIKEINLASTFTLASIIENYNIQNPKDIASKITITEDDSYAMIDKLAKAVNFKEIDGDQDNSFEEGNEDKKINLDDSGNYVGKGKTTIYDKEIDLENEENSKQRWVETPTGKASDGETEQVPNPQELENFNESTTINKPEITSKSLLTSLIRKGK